MHAVFTIGSVLGAAAGVQLFVLTDHTDRFFAWTVDSGLSAAFLGGFYLMAVIVAQESAREVVWARARVGVYGVTLFVSLTLLATLLHVDKFHLDQGEAAARVAAWVWLAVYVAAPVGAVAAVVRQHRAPGSDPPRERPLPTWYRALLGVQSVAYLAIGLLLLVAPASATWWPWSLTPSCRGRWPRGSSAWGSCSGPPCGRTTGGGSA